MSNRVLVSGANGFIGAHIVAKFLKEGYSVRAVVRSQEKADGVKKDQGQHSGSLDFAIVEDIEADGAFDEALKSDPPFTAVVHAASPFHYGASGSNKEVYLDPAKKGTTGILKSIKKVAPDVTRVAVTSSFAAIVDPKRSKTDGHVYTEKDWDPLTEQDCLDCDQPTAYRGSKTIAEQAAWDFVKNEKPNFQLTTLCPPIVYGPLIHSVKSVDDLNTSVAAIYKSLVKGKKSTDPIPDETIWLIVDVRDLAEAHFLAVTADAAANHRIFVSSGSASNQEVADILREIPELADRVPKGNPGTSSLPKGAFSGDNSFSKSLGLKYRPAKDTITEMGKAYLAIEAQS